MPLQSYRTTDFQSFPTDPYTRATCNRVAGLGIIVVIQHRVVYFQLDREGQPLAPLPLGPNVVPFV